MPEYNDRAGAREEIARLSALVEDLLTLVRADSGIDLSS
jgi:hypothetical protein